MLRTIAIGTCLQVQGTPVGMSPTGKLMVRVGDRVFCGWPIPKTVAVEPPSCRHPASPRCA